MKRHLASTVFILVLFVGTNLIGFGQEPVPQTQTADPEMVVPPGAILSIVLTSYLNTRSTQVGDLFYAETIYPVWIQQRLTIPKGAMIKGSVTQVERPGRFKGKGRLAIRLESILLPNGIQRDLIASLRGIHGGGTEKIDRKKETVEAESSKGVDVGEVVGNAGQGAIIGAISGGGKAAGIGAGAGAAFGLATILFTRGQDLILQPGTQFDLELKQPLRFAYGELEFTAQQMNSTTRIVPPAGPRYDRDRNHRPNGGRRIFGFPWLYP